MIEKIIKKITKFLSKYPSKLIGNQYMFVLWDRKCNVIEFYFFGKVLYL